MNDDQFTCEQCGRTMPRVIDGVHQVTCAMNLGWGMMEFCRSCKPPATADEAYTMLRDAMCPKQEMPETKPEWN